MTATAWIESARLAALIDNLNQAVLMETPDRQVARTNQAFCDMFRVPAPPAALVGGDCVEAARALGPLLGDVEPFLARVDELIAAWETVTGERIRLTDGRLLERDFLPVTHTDGTREIAWVYRDVTEWERLRAAAEDAAQQNAELLSAISHDVRTPVTGIVGLVELLQRQPIDARTRQIVDSVRQSAASLTTMLDDFLDAAKADAGLLEVVPEPVRPESLLESVTDMVGPLARAKGLILVTGVSPELPEMVVVDGGRVRQILLNLVSNAVKFTPSGAVALTAERDGDELVIECRDTGPGLGSQPPDEVFRAFVRGADAKAHTTRGAGLGLAIASKLASVMGGSLRVTKSDRSGSTFQLRLPLVAGDVGQGGAALRGQRVWVSGPELPVSVVTTALRRSGASIVEQSSDSDVSVLITETVPKALLERPSGRIVVLAPVEPFAVPADAEHIVATPVTEAALCAAVLGLDMATPVIDLPPLPDGFRALVVEDDSTNRVLISRMLEVLGVLAVPVADGIAALQAVGQDRFDVVLMDIHMPGLDGVETTGLIRQRRGETSDDRLPVIAMTGSSGWTDPELMLTAGFDGTLPKPMTLPELHECLSALVVSRDPAEAVGATGSAGRGQAQGQPHRSDPAPAAGAAPVDPGPSVAVDQEVLTALVEDTGDEQLVRDTVGTYLDELPLRLAALQVAVRTDDQRGMKETAHSLKSASAMLGAHRMASLCAALEERAAARTGSDTDVRAVVDEAVHTEAGMRSYLQ